MKKFIAYFDYLGFKQFIDNNDIEYQKKVMGSIFRDIERALGHGNYQKVPQGVSADLSNSKINCINFSDTVVFWTNDGNEESLIELLKVAYTFNWQSIVYSFPTRGSIVFGEIEYGGFNQKNEGGGLYNINSLFGKGLVKAHEKADKQQWAGTVIDDSFIDELLNRGKNIETYLKPYAKKFKVPYKNDIELPEEFVFCLIEDFPDEMVIKNREIRIRENFARHKKSVENQDVMEKIENTINFLTSFKSK